MFSRNPLVHRITTFSTGVALGLSILSGAASAAPATPANPSGNNGVAEADKASPGDEMPSVDAAPVDVTPPADEATPPVVVDPTVPTTLPPVVIDDSVAPPPVVSDSQVKVTDPVSSEVRPLVVAGRGVPVVPVVALAPGNWGMSARVVGVRRAPSVLSFGTASVQAEMPDDYFSAGGELPRTGAGTGLLTIVAILLLLVGTVLTRQGRAPFSAPSGTRSS